MTPRTSPPKCTGATTITTATGVIIGITTAIGVIIGIIIATGPAGNTSRSRVSELRRARKLRACLAWLLSLSGERAHEDVDWRRRYRSGSGAVCAGRDGERRRDQFESRHPCD